MTFLFIWVSSWRAFFSKKHMHSRPRNAKFRWTSVTRSTLLLDMLQILVSPDDPNVGLSGSAWPLACFSFRSPHSPRLGNKHFVVLADEQTHPYFCFCKWQRIVLHEKGIFVGTEIFYRSWIILLTGVNEDGCRWSRGQIVLVISILPLKSTDNKWQINIFS